MQSNYDKRPIVPISDDHDVCVEGWMAIEEGLRRRIEGVLRCVVVVEVYPGIDSAWLAAKLSTALGATFTFNSQNAYLDPETLQKNFAETISDDPVFNVMRPWTIDAYFDRGRLAEAKEQIRSSGGVVLVVGPGAYCLVDQPDLLISANLTRWEIQQRQRSHRIGNLGFDNTGASPSELYKTAFFLDWRVADRARHEIYRRVDLFFDLNDEENPKLLPGATLRAAVRTTVQRPFRVVPFFDPGPWGGQWMRRQFDLPKEPQNYAWGFDCVPEENSVLLGFGARHFELPAIVLVHEEPELLLGHIIYERFGAEFPIRFDLLDTVGGGNLSLQVHPRERYIRDHFGMPYTQDESYYMLHSEPGSSMYLGLRDGTERVAVTRALEKANAGGASFPAAEFVARWPTRTHDHFSIPAGTIHCSGEGNVVLEISATPYIFTFKLWDWGRTGLDGHPRPIHLEHGLANVQWDRTSSWVRRELIDQTVGMETGEGWHEERTGLHPTQFLETRRHWFSLPVPHDTLGNLHVLNLVAGNEAVVSSPADAFNPMTVHFAETFIVPACVGRYTIKPASLDKTLMATIKAYVRP